MDGYGIFPNGAAHKVARWGRTQSASTDTLSGGVRRLKMSATPGTLSEGARAVSSGARCAVTRPWTRLESEDHLAGYSTNRQLTELRGERTREMHRVHIFHTELSGYKLFFIMWCVR